MAIPFEAAPATVFKESDIAEFGLALQDRQEAKEQRERERYEKTLESVSGPYWAERDTWIAQGGNKLLEMATDPAYYKAPIGSANHNKFIRAKRQYEQLLATSAANQKYFNEQLKFAQQNPDAEGMQDLNAYVGMDMQGDVEIDEAGNFVVAGQPIITSDAMSTPPSLRKRQEEVNLEDIYGVKMGQYTTPDGVLVTPSRNDVREFVEGGFRGMKDQDKYFKQYVNNKFREKYRRNPASGYAEQEIESNPNLYNEFIDYLTEQNIKTYNYGGGRKSDDGGGGAFGVDNSKVTVTPVPLGEYSVGEGDAAVKSELYGFSTKPIAWVGDESKDKGAGYFVDVVQFDKDGNMVVSGYKSAGSIEASLMAMAMGEIEAGVDVREVLKKYNIKTEPLNQKKLSESEASSFSSSLKDKHKALAPLKTVAQIRDWTADYVGYSPKSKEEVTEGGQSSGGAMSGFNKGN